MNFIKTTNLDTIREFRAKLYQELTAPIDAMWELLYIASSQFFLIEKDTHTIGYCCIDDQASLLQLFLLKQHRSQMGPTISALIDSGRVGAARLSSNEPVSFNTCLLQAKAIKPNTFCFEHTNTPQKVDDSFTLELVSETAIPLIKVFLKEQVGMDDTFGYTENLVARKEIFMLKESDNIIATSERRMSDTQPDIADLGIIVNTDFQGRGIATQLMKMQVNNVLKAGRRPICSTTLDNVASRKAIEKAGFYCSNIIFDISFTAD